MSQHTFENLAKLAVKACNDPTKSPVQWIYAVDDAWLHSGFSDNDKQRSPVFDNAILCGNGLETKKVAEVKSALEVKRTALKEAPKTEGSADAFGNTETMPASEADSGDLNTAIALLEFVTKHVELNYGVCFCTFEFFWTQIETINDFKNAVLFDIRHQLAIADTSSGLTKAWDDKLQATGIFGMLQNENEQPNAVVDLQILGFQIYFAYKLGRILGAETRNINPNHLAILSSNLFENVGNREGALQSFLNLQKTIWTAIATQPNSRGTFTPLDFTFVPLPKHQDQGLFNTGLDILHNSLRRAASWTFKSSCLLSDMESLWVSSEEDEKWGHVADGDATAKTLKCSGWLHGNGLFKKADLRGLFLVQWREEHGVSVKCFDSFLRWAVDHGTVGFRSLDNGINDARVEFSTRPGILYVLAMALFIRGLAHGSDKPGCVKPVAFWSIDQSQVTLTIKLTDSGVRDLEEKFYQSEKGTKDGAASSLRRVAAAQFLMLDTKLGDPSATIGDIERHRTTLRQKIADKSEGNHYPPHSGAPHFSGDSIVFYFPKASPPKSGA